MRYAANLTCLIDMDMKAHFHEYLTNCPNPLNREPMRLVGGGMKIHVNLTTKFLFIFHLGHLLTPLIFFVATLRSSCKSTTDLLCLYFRC